MSDFDGLVAAGGWCAPAGIARYDLLARRPDWEYSDDPFDDLRFDVTVAPRLTAALARLSEARRRLRSARLALVKPEPEPDDWYA